MICTFFGHNQFDYKYISKLREVIEDLIVNYNVDKFYVGNHGNFDIAAQEILKDLNKIYPYITYYVVLAYLPNKNSESGRDYTHTIMPDGFERVPKRAAIIYRNNWMLEKSDFVVSYIIHSTLSRAAQFTEKAKRLNKKCINIAEE